MKNLTFVLLIIIFFSTSAIYAQEPDINVHSMIQVDLTPSSPSGQVVGKTIIWTVTAISPNPVDYRLSIGPAGEPVRVMYDFSPDNVFAWTPIDDGTYIIEASVRNISTGEIIQAQTNYVIEPLVTDEPLITPTDHPLVVLYSAPPCPAGNEMRVLFTLYRRILTAATTSKPCRTGHTVNFYIAGLRPLSTYSMRYEILDENGAHVVYGLPQLHITGALAVDVPDRVLVNTLDDQTSLAESIILHSPIIGTDEVPPFPFATDLVGRVIWYDYSPLGGKFLYRPVAGGTFLMGIDVSNLHEQILREVDLAGHTVRQTTTQRITEQLLAQGQDAFGAFHHEALRLPNGHTAVLGSVERLLRDVQGDGLVNVLGDYVVVLDQNWQVAWVWNSFDHMDLTRLATLDETCVHQGPGCPPLFLSALANDWLHSNSIGYSPADGNLILSVRHQDWVVKINYLNGLGTGDVIWRLGLEGDFTLESDDPYPWFSHQHDANYISEDQIIIYDNGNTRCDYDQDLCYSRGQLYLINEKTMTASLVLNADLGNYSFALGSAQILANGNAHFNSGIIPWDGPGSFSTADEVLPDGSIAYSLQVNMPVYRSFRMSDLYRSPDLAVSIGPLHSLYLPVVLK